VLSVDGVPEKVKHAGSFLPAFKIEPGKRRLRIGVSVTQQRSDTFWGIGTFEFDFDVEPNVQYEISRNLVYSRVEITVLNKTTGKIAYRSPPLRLLPARVAQ
jgi:hypothetical protein